LAFRHSSLKYYKTEADSQQTLREIDSIKSLLENQPDSTYFIFDCNDGSVSYFDNSNAFLEKIKRMGYPEIPPMPTVYENWRVYVRPPQDSSYRQIGPDLPWGKQ